MTRKSLFDFNQKYNLSRFFRLRLGGVLCRNGMPNGEKYLFRQLSALAQIAQLQALSLRTKLVLKEDIHD